jgi:hypothetical protein
MADSKWAKKFREYVSNTPSLIQKVESLFVQYSNQTGELQSISDEIIESVPMSGHPTGYFMARAIIAKLEKEELLRNMGNPFEFFRLYNRVARAHDDLYPMFSEEAMNVIDRLEEKYSHP